MGTELDKEQEDPTRGGPEKIEEPEPTNETSEGNSVDNPEVLEENVESTSELQAKVAETYQKNAELQNNFLRKAADLDNMRKRFAREREEITTYTLTSFVEDLLPAVDAFRAGVDAAQGKEDSEEFAKGFVMALEIMDGILHQRGIENINPPPGELPDPQLHKTIGEEPSEEVEEGRITRVLRLGYRLKERLVREAEVMVSTGKADIAASETGPVAE